MIKDFSIFQKMMLLKDNIAYLNSSINEEFRKDGQIYYNDFDDEKIKRIQESVAYEVLEVIGYLSQGGLKSEDTHEYVCPRLKEQIGNHFYKYRIIIDYPEIDSFATDGVNLYISSNFVLHPWGRDKQLSLREIEFILCHEYFHILLNHNFREKPKPTKYEHEKWNYAADYEENLFIDDLKLVKTDIQTNLSACLNYDYRGKTAEEIYNIFDNDDIKNRMKNKDSGKPKFVLKEGMLVRNKKTGEYGLIKKVYDDGHIDCEIISEQQANDIIKSYQNQ